MKAALTELDAVVSVTDLSAALGVARATADRWRQPPAPVLAVPTPLRPRAPSPRALQPQETAQVLTVLHSARFVDRSPTQVFATLLDEDRYLCSPRTMYRVLAAYHELHERRPQLSHPPHAIPRLTATAPNQVWTWDITDLHGPKKGIRYKLYVVMDLYSRYVVAWLLAPRESKRYAKRIIQVAYQRHGIVRGQLTAHSDRGPGQTSLGLNTLFEKLGVERSLSRPRVSNDNPYSESLFKTVKYTAGYPTRFASMAHAKQWCATFFEFYNNQHCHSNLAYLTPAIVFRGDAEVTLTKRHATLTHAYARHPERFVRGCPARAVLPAAVSINPAAEAQTAEVQLQ